MNNNTINQYTTASSITNSSNVMTIYAVKCHYQSDRDTPEYDYVLASYESYVHACIHTDCAARFVSMVNHYKNQCGHKYQYSKFTDEELANVAPYSPFDNHYVTKTHHTYYDVWYSIETITVHTGNTKVGQ